MFTREIGAASLVIERDLIENDEGEEESTRSAAWRMQSLECSISRCGSHIVGEAYMICRIGKVERGKGWLATKIDRRWK